MIVSAYGRRKYQRNGMEDSNRNHANFDCFSAQALFEQI
jgi:hypothetical protein